jgi:hypothetical protein
MDSIQERSVEDDKIKRASFFNPTKSLRRDSIASGGNNSTMMMDTGVDLLNRVQMFQIAVNKLNQRGGDQKKEMFFKLGINASETAAKYSDNQ